MTSVITWRTTKATAGYRWQVYSFGYQVPQVVLAEGTCLTRHRATRRAKLETRRLKVEAARAAVLGVEAVPGADDAPGASPGL